MSKMSSVRIIGGRHRGRRISFTDPKGEVRPSSDRLRETLFNWLQFELNGAKVLDAFAGTGVLGAEAISRGAAHASFIDITPHRCQQLTQQLTPILGEQHNVVCHDALTWLKESHPTPFHLVFVDPPYHLKVQAQVCQTLVERQWLAPKALIYVESHSKEQPPQVPAQWQLKKEKIMGQIRAQLFEHQA